MKEESVVVPLGPRELLNSIPISATEHVFSILSNSIDKHPHYVYKTSYIYRNICHVAIIENNSFV